MGVSRVNLFGIDMYIDCRIRVKRCGSDRVYCGAGGGGGGWGE